MTALQNVSRKHFLLRYAWYVAGVDHAE
jgi:hypothetical protein